MGSISIKDTGKRRVDSTEITEFRVHGDSGPGTPLTLKTAEASVKVDTMVSEDTPVGRTYLNSDVGYFEWGESDHIGIQMPVWQLKGFANRENEEDMKTLGRLFAMCRTSGYKELYSATGEGWKDIIAYSKYGTRELLEEPVKTVEFINVRIKDMDIRQNSTKKGFNYTLTLVETN